ncbi:hypothetical protein [Bradyrhizobium japonicum]|uniref:hypothetical protein n=1 Tax=Bradyrhizobium japonicum TaxID=375 RepID=UPI000462D1E0|nr:hypothetical protein [Bradyrhizobium japonicum]
MPELDSTTKGFSGQSFVSALEEYTKRIETSATEIEQESEKTLLRLFGYFIFVAMLGVTVGPLIGRVADEIGGNFRSLVQATMLGGLFALFALGAFTIYARLMRTRRLRRNLETLLWPYEKLLQKLSQILEHGDLDEGASTLIQLKILESEVAYGRARRAIETAQAPFNFFGTSRRSASFDSWDVERLSNEFEIPLVEARYLLDKFWPDRDKARAAAAKQRADRNR